MEWPKPSSARSSVTMSASVRVRMQRPSCTSYQLGSITTTRFTRTRHSDIVHPVSSSQLTEARDRVRSFGGYNKDEADGHNDALRRDLNALTEEQWQYYFKVERKQPDIELGGQLIVRESEERPRVLYIWVAAIAAGFGIAIGAIQASHYLSCRRLCRTIIATADTSHIPPSAPVDIQSSRTC